jgi:hypothetical protein
VFDRNLTLFVFVLKLVMAAFNIHQMPSVRFQFFNQLRTIPSVSVGVFDFVGLGFSG